MLLCWLCPYSRSWSDPCHYYCPFSCFSSDIYIYICGKNEAYSVQCCFTFCVCSILTVYVFLYINIYIYICMHMYMHIYVYISPIPLDALCIVEFVCLLYGLCWIALCCILFAQMSGFIIARCNLY